MADFSRQVDESLVAVNVDATDVKLRPIPNREQVFEHRAKCIAAGYCFGHLSEQFRAHDPKARILMKVFQRICDMIALPRGVAFSHDPLNLAPGQTWQPPTAFATDYKELQRRATSPRVIDRPAFSHTMR
jgi:hypothetical protein